MTWCGPRTQQSTSLCLTCPLSLITCRLYNILLWTGEKLTSFIVNQFLQINVHTFATKKSINSTTNHQHIKNLLYFPFHLLLSHQISEYTTAFIFPTEYKMSRRECKCQCQVANSLLREQSFPVVERNFPSGN